MMDLEDLSRNNPDLTANDIVGAMDPRHEGLNNPIALQYGIVVSSSTASHFSYTEANSQ